MSGCFFFDPFASTARLADAGGIAAPRLSEFLLPPSDRRAAQSRDDRQVLDPSSTVGCRPEAGKQSSPSLVQGGDQKIDGPMLLDDLAPETSLAIRTTTDMDHWGWGPGFHGSPLSCERKEVSLIVPRNQSTYSWPAPDAATGSGPGPVSHRLGVGAGRQRAAGRAGCAGVVDGELGAPGDQPDALRGSRPWRSEPAQDDRAECAPSDHVGDARGRGDRTTRGADGLASAGDQRAGVAAVVGGFGAGLPRGDVRGACVPPVEGPTAGDSAAVRASGRSGARLDPSADAGVARPDAV